jgi:hypothetical protein
MIKKGFIALVLAFFLSTPLFAANDDLLMSVSQSELMAILHSEGYAASIDEDGDLMWKVEGVKTYFFFDHDGKIIKFHVSFSGTDATLMKINEWNSTKRFSRSFLNSNGNPTLILDLDLTGGITKARLLDYIATCKMSLNSWYKQVVKDED